MSLPYCGQARFEPLRSRVGTTMLATYQILGSPYTHPIRLLKLTNDTDENLIISFDGVTDHVFLAANSFDLYDFCSNMATQGGFLEQPQGTQIYVRAVGVAIPTTGNVYASTMYAHKGS